MEVFELLIKNIYREGEINGFVLGYKAVLKRAKVKVSNIEHGFRQHHMQLYVFNFVYKNHNITS